MSNDLPPFHVTTTCYGILSYGNMLDIVVQQKHHHELDIVTTVIFTAIHPFLTEYYKIENTGIL